MTTNTYTYDFKIGDKVIVHNKSYGCPRGNSTIYRKCINQGYGYITRVHDECVEINYESYGAGDFFARRDIEHFTPPVHIPEELFEIE